jgi:DNA-binding beta-propeller fold protein YncE
MDRFISRMRQVCLSMTLTILLAGLPAEAQARTFAGAGGDFAVAPKGLAFPDKVFGVSGERSWPKLLKISISQHSGRPLTIKRISIAGANRSDFAIHQIGNCVGATLTTGCAVTVTFTPTGLGRRTAALTVTDSAGVSAESVALSGRGIKGRIKWEPREISFGKVRPGASSQPEPVSITNPNAAPLTITNISLKSADFVASQTHTCMGPLAPHASCKFYVAASPQPTAAKSRKASIEAELDIQDAAAGNPHRVMLSARLSGPPVLPPPPPPPAGLAKAILVTNTPCNNVTSYAIAASGNVAPTFPQPLLCNPTGIAVDASKNIYVTNSGVDGNPSYSVAVYPPGSDGQVAPSSVIASSATGLDIPQGIALDGTGNIYVVNDGSNNGDADSVTVYPAASSRNAAPSAVISGPGTGLNLPDGVAIFSGKIYVSNFGNNSVTVYPVGSTGNTAPSATISGFGTGLAGPHGIALDSGGKIYVSNDGNNSVTVYAAGSSGNAAPSATISGVNTGLLNPIGISVESGNIYVVNDAVLGPGNESNVTVYPEGSNGNVAPSATISGSGTALDEAESIALDSAGKIYVTNEGSYNGGSDTVTIYPAGSSGNATPNAIINRQFALSLTGLAQPAGIAVDSTGIYVTNVNNSVTVYAAGSSGNAAPTATISGSITGLSNPTGIALHGGNIYVANQGTDTVTVYPEGSTGNIAPSSTLNTVGGATGVAVDSGGNIYVFGFSSNQLFIYPPGSSGNATPSGVLDTSIGIGSIALDSANNIYVASRFDVLPPFSVIVYPAGSTGSATPSATITGSKTGLQFPTGIAVDSAGSIYVANDGNGFGKGGADTVTVYSAGSNGNVAPSATITGPLTALDAPAAIAIDSVKKIYVANDGTQNDGSDSVTVYPAGSNGNIRPTDIIQFSPNNGMDEPTGIALDSNANIYVTNLNSGNGINPAIYPAGSGATGALLTNRNTNIVSTMPTGIVLDSSQNVYIAELSKVEIFSSLTGGLSPLATLHGDLTEISDAAGIALDGNANIYLTNDASDSLGDRVTVYPAGSSGNMPPSAVIVGSNTGLAFPAGIAVDSALNIYVANPATGAVTVYAPGSNGNVTPTATISGPSTGLNTPTGITLDSNGLIYVTNQGGYEGNNLSVTVYAAGSTGNATPLTTIAGPVTQLARPRGIAILP